MVNALLNMVIGMFSVFMVLIIIALVISCFRFIPIIQAKFNKSKQTNVESKNTTAANNEPSVNSASVMANEELVAIITAAISQFTEMSSDGFVVKSIRRR